MKISGFTFVRNGTLAGYPFIESIRSLLPLVDEFVVNVGEGSDDTLVKIKALAAENPKIRIIESIWNEQMQQKGFVYAQQKMIAQYSCTGDWAFYLEADEVVHEDDIPKIRALMEKHLHNPQIEALAFDYYHFYGSPQHLWLPPSPYFREARVIRNTIRSYAPDGLFWVVMDHNKRGRYPNAALTHTRIYHYGHVRAAEREDAKRRLVLKYWESSNPVDLKKYVYGNCSPNGVGPFTGTHPVLMKDWLTTEANQSFEFNPDYKPTLRDRRHQFARWFERKTGIRMPMIKGHFVVKDAG